MPLRLSPVIPVSTFLAPALMGAARAGLLALCVAGAPAAACAADAAGAGAGAAARVESAASADVAARAGIRRFIEVDARLTRGSQPDAVGFRALRDLGVRTVISLRNDEAERKEVESLGMVFVNIPVKMKPFGMSGELSSEAIARFFAIVDNPANGKVYLHCRRGADRTGTFIALYRITRQGWDIDRAYDEARDLGMRWWHGHVRDQLKTLSASFTPAAAEARPAALPASTLIAPAS